MTHRERFVRVLAGREADRVPFIKVFGGTNAIVPRWENEHPGIGRCIDQLLRFDGPYRGWQITPVNTWLSRRGQPEVTRTPRGEVLQRWRDGTADVLQPGADFHSHQVGFPVRSRDDWERVKREHLDPDDPERFPADWEACVEGYRARDYPLQLTHGGVYGAPRRLMGDEALAYAFYDDPELVHDMMAYYTEFCIRIWERMVHDVEFDLIECWEDMASNSGSLVSPQVFRAFMKPHYRRLAEFVEAHGIPILLVDCDGYIEKLTELMLESGVTALYPFEVQAGNDSPKMLDSFPKLGIIGGLNKNVMAHGKDAIDREMQRARALISKGRFIPGPDHFVLSDVTFANYRYFMEQLREVVLSTRPGV